MRGVAMFHGMRGMLVVTLADTLPARADCFNDADDRHGVNSMLLRVIVEQKYGDNLMLLVTTKAAPKTLE
ncbi:hypothetical protein VL15_37890 [Burkholderia cepacia]|uniref:Uncharacterized protein n=1 Tax=Burkholderia cepacia TaxID=292 RepID=A0A0J5VYB1_BURCE|nr:hypothetical protein VL15_37890 [Burkholderia cepacia]